MNSRARKKGDFACLVTACRWRDATRPSRLPLRDRTADAIKPVVGPPQAERARTRPDALCRKDLCEQEVFTPSDTFWGCSLGAVLGLTRDVGKGYPSPMMSAAPDTCTCKQRINNSSNDARDRANLHSLRVTQPCLTKVGTDAGNHSHTGWRQTLQGTMSLTSEAAGRLAAPASSTS